jgi:hypothetical protein
MRERGPDIRRSPLEELPLDQAKLTGSIAQRMVQQLLKDAKTLKEAMEQVKQTIADAGDQLRDAFEGVLVGAAEGLGSGSRSVVGAVAEATGAMLGAIGRMAIHFGLAASTIGKFMQKIMASLASLTPTGAIIAGLALVAFGAALQSAAASSFGGGGSGGTGASATPAPITTTHTLGGSTGTASTAPASQAPTSNLASLRPAPMVTVHQTIIGERDPVAQRAVARMAALAAARGAA